MTTTIAPAAAPAGVVPAPALPSEAAGFVISGYDDAEPPGAIRLRLASLGIDFCAPDFPARFIDFCEDNDLYEMEVNEAGE